MDAIGTLKESLNTADMVAMAYLTDLSDEELMQRPHKECNHINWQVGHLIAAEHQMMSGVAADAMPALPEGFAEKYTKETAASDNAADFHTKDELMAAYQAQREGTKKFLETCSEADLDKETGIDYAPTLASLFTMQGCHWLMHCGQWVIVRRETGKPIVI